MRGMMGRECKWCDRGWAAIGFVFGALVILVSLDLMLDGRLTELATRPTKNPNDIDDLFIEEFDEE